MFNDINQENKKTDKLNNSGPINNNTLSSSAPFKKEVDDIFAETEEVEKPTVFKPKDTSQAPNTTASDIDRTHSRGKRKKIFVLIIIIAGGMLLGSGGYLAYGVIMDKLSGNTDSKNLLINEALDDDGALENPQAAKKDNNNIENINIPQRPTDTDDDGLTDEEEKALGTDINSVDTDTDGLFDQEEVRVYKTDPLLSDSDGDGFSDGDEVKAGYNPNGPGRLYEIE